MLRLAWYTADSIRRFDSKTNRTADSIRDSIRKNDSQVPTQHVPLVKLLYYIKYVTVSTYKLQQHDELNHKSHTPCLRGPCTDGERPLASEQHSSLGRLLASVCELTQTRTVVKHTMTRLSYHWHKLHLHSQAANLRLWHLMNSLTHEICPMTLILAVSRSLWRHLAYVVSMLSTKYIQQWIE